MMLLGDSDEVLSISESALESHNLAGVFGSPLEAGEKMYRDLQDKYSS